MSPLEATLFWIAVSLYAVISVVYIYAVVFGKARLLDRMPYAIALAFAVETGAIIARYIAVGNLPVAGAYENGLGSSWFIVLTTLYLVFRHKPLRAAGVVTLPFALWLMGYGVMVGADLAPMTASVKSIWMVVHVFFAWAAFGAYAVATGLSVMYVLKQKWPEREMHRKFPSLEQLDDRMFRFLVFGFITDAVMIASGSLWAKDLWGGYWGWDPVETWSLVTWLIYGLAIHLRVTMGWRGFRMAVLLILALFGMFVTYFAIDWFVTSSLHIFDVEW